MQIKLLQDLVEELAGVNTGRIVNILYGKKDVNEFNLAKKMELTINQVRNILYKLSAEGLVTFIRKKDKRKGWYIYYWTLKTEKCLVKLEESLARKIERLGVELDSRETKRYYICHSCAIEVSEEKALENGFTCEECAEVYELADNTNNIRDVKSKTTRTEKDLELVRIELEAIRLKESRKRARENKKIVREADKKKALLKAVRAAARKKVAASKKKIVKKKVSKKKVVKKVRKKVGKKLKKVTKKANVVKRSVKKVGKKKVKSKGFFGKIRKSVASKKKKAKKN